MIYASIANKLISKGGPAIRKAGEHLGAFLLILNAYNQECLRLDIYLCKNKCEFNSSI